MNLAALLSLAIVVFAATNIDDIFVLLGFLADPSFRLRNVAIGQFLGIGLLVLVSLSASLISLVLAADYVGLLGALPVVIGVAKVSALRRSPRGDSQRHRADGGSIAQMAAVAAVTVANGGDNIGVYTPLFATQTIAAKWVTVIVFFTLTALWIAIAHRLTSHRTLGAPLRRYGHIAVPFVLIGLGFYILCGSGSFQLMRTALVQLF